VVAAVIYGRQAFPRRERNAALSRPALDLLEVGGSRRPGIVRRRLLSTQRGGNLVDRLLAGQLRWRLTAVGSGRSRPISVARLAIIPSTTRKPGTSRTKVQIASRELPFGHSSAMIRLRAEVETLGLGTGLAGGWPA
jgi:hypothetical protein